MSESLELTAIKAEFDKKYERYHKQPMSHPHYKIEWNKWWANKTLELKAQGIKIRDRLDYQLEWFKFWHKRVDQFKKIEIDIHKEKLRLEKEPLNFENSSSTSHVISKINAFLKRPRTLIIDSGIDPKRPRLENASLISVSRLLSPIQKYIDRRFVHKFFDYFLKFSKGRIVGKNDTEMMTKEYATFLLMIKEHLIGHLVYESLDMMQLDDKQKIQFAVRNIEKLLEKHSFIKSKQDETEEACQTQADSHNRHNEVEEEVVETVVDESTEIARNSEQQTIEIVETVARPPDENNNDLTSDDDETLEKPQRKFSTPRSRRKTRIFNRNSAEKSNTNEIIDDQEEDFISLGSDSIYTIDSTISESETVCVVINDDPLNLRTDRRSILTERNYAFNFLSLTDDEILEKLKIFNDFTSKDQCEVIESMMFLKKFNVSKFEAVKASSKKLKILSVLNIINSI